MKINSIDISDLYGIQREIYNDDETVDLGSIELRKTIQENIY